MSQQDILPAIEGGTPVFPEPLFVLPEFTEEEIKTVVNVLKSGELTLAAKGKYTKIFEKAFAEFIGSKYAIAVMNGTAALHVALRAIGVKPGDEVITTPFTFVATASSIVHQNAIPVFADIDRKTFNIDPASVEDRITEKTKAVIAVHIAGHPAEMDDLMKIGEEHNLIIVEDAAQAIGAEYRGRKVGSIGSIATFSLYLSKNITTGEGGMVTTDSEEYWRKAQLIRHHGQTRSYHYEEIGYNYRMTELQAALGYVQLKRINQLNERRREIVKIYNEVLEGEEALILPISKPYVKHVWHIYNILLKLEKLRVNRDRIVQALKMENIPISTAYPSVLYLEPAFQRMEGHGNGCPWSCPFYGKKISYFKGLCPNAEWVSERVFTLLTMPSITDEQAVKIAEAVRKVVRYYKVA
ncbi:MAG: DegT/DnrJ/EryC1/StrS aminotransferase [Thermoprotei archaeon]|nr:MAG: DegT/DnrJ/EryC1/StrS aminotransferase [Thermoprotei archaeon]